MVVVAVAVFLLIVLGIVWVEWKNHQRKAEEWRNL